ncbi:MAG TPA: hypothetical protein VNM39_13360 [Verrucomicrobiae bacterium]|nr:hypothetical protein [Verrucomicrobiae bacterium]
MSTDAITFECPGCKRPCRVSGAQRAVQHSDPVCKLWVAHKGDRTGQKMQDFLGLALMAKGAAALDLSGLQVPDAERPFTEHEKNDAIEELHEGLKKL